ncbi:glucan 1,3-beta-glucosidase Exg2 [Schizosaccharomyces japonicus yFS275]|uniref:glucan 1,3-beta-glucosidase n=1 Tax=Schizosaccharomyces japonicus (strain yFS275 / FY16936) TaxID=402676 RepID=B6JZ64_SCHJY|nr:glucan 1,3-beta-glucosidase Exg2 [Schizosaccharomyces japonicus yFS275]EEB06832.1 glucan 1,3-beta-glucosidase Exg2 [Schizosaccharomyces japonicus yFS275]
MYKVTADSSTDDSNSFYNISQDETKPFYKRIRKRDICTAFFSSLFTVILFSAIFFPIVFCSILPKIRQQYNNATNDTTDMSKGKVLEVSSPKANFSEPVDIPDYVRGTYLDASTWLTTDDFNTTFTNETVGGLSIMGLFSFYNDCTRANPGVPPLNSPFPYGSQPVRGVNLGGWLSMEPFITPSFFEKYGNGTHQLTDETELHQFLGQDVNNVIETHYNTFVTKDTFREIREAGLDHVRIPFPYWILFSSPNETHPFQIGWRYLLRGIEWARENGLRVNLDLHAVPGNQNSWNHGGTLGVLNWLDGSELGQKNADLTLKLHEMLATFFAQERYKNIVTIYGIVNEPNMFVLENKKVIDWHKEAYKTITAQGYSGYIVASDGFTGVGSIEKNYAPIRYPNMVIDIHRYTIFDSFMLRLSHIDTLHAVCDVWDKEFEDNAFLPSFVGEWSLADTDCAKFLNDVGEGTRWEGNFSAAVYPNGGCAVEGACSCDIPNADPLNYPPSYKTYLNMYALSQMEVFEKTWGWFFWNWDTETSAQWSYKKSRNAGILPKLAYEKSADWNCSILQSSPLFKIENLEEYY